VDFIQPDARGRNGTSAPPAGLLRFQKREDELLSFRRFQPRTFPASPIHRLQPDLRNTEPLVQIRNQLGLAPEAVAHHRCADGDIGACVQ
jgi:hypothetical protein